MKQRFFARYLFVISLTIVIILMLAVTASAENIDNALFITKLNEVKTRFKDGEYFAGNDGTGVNLTYSSPTVLCNGYNLDNHVACIITGYCKPPCTCKCGTYYYDGAARTWQCWAFACQVGYDIFGVDPYSHWETHRNVYSVKAGDIIRFSWSASYQPHSIFVTNVDGDTVYYGQSNMNGPCKIQWDCSKSKAELQELLNNRTDKEFCVYHSPNNQTEENFTGTLDVNAILDGMYTGGSLVKDGVIYGSFDVYVGGELKYDDVTDIPPSNYPAGYSYEIKDIKPAKGHLFNGSSTEGAEISGTITSGQNTEVRLRFNTCIDLGDDFYACIMTKDNCFLENSTNGGVVNSAVSENAFSYDPKQIWHFVRASSGDFEGSYMLFSAYDDSVLDAENWGTISGTALQLLEGKHANDMNSAQHWYIGPDVNAMNYNIATSYGPLAIDICGSNNSAHLWIADGTNENQRLNIYKLSDMGISYVKPSPPAVTMLNVDARDPDHIIFNWSGSYEGPFDSRAYNVSLYSSDSAEPIKTLTNTKSTSWEIDLHPGQYTIIVEAVNTKYLDLSSSSTKSFSVSRSYTITYDANGGTGAPAAQTVDNGTASLSTVQPVRQNHRFLGWATSAVATSAEYQPGSSYSGNGDITLYAVWERKLDNVLILPTALTEIEAEAFFNTATEAVVIPRSVTKISNNAFGDIGIYGYEGSYAETWANANGLTFIPISTNWVLDNEVPHGAHITDEKWTYTLTTSETTTSTETSLSGWNQVGYTWQSTGTGTWNYANFPSGFDAGSSLYSKYNKSAINSSSSDTTKREVGSTSHLIDIYWHWTFTDYVEDSNRNVNIEDSRKLGVNISGSVYRDFIYFDAFETTTSLSQEGMTTSGLRTFDGLWSTYHHPEYNLPEYASWWWYRFEVYQQTYTDYQKLFTYVKDDIEVLESSTEVVSGDDISNVQHWVKYAF